MDDRLFLLEGYRILSSNLPDNKVWAYGSSIKATAHEGRGPGLVLWAAELAPIPASRMEALREADSPIIVDVQDWVRMPGSFRQDVLADHVTFRRRSHDGNGD